MPRTVDDLRNEIRVAVDRFERVESTGFTKETLAAICEAMGIEIGEGRLPPTAEMRSEIRSALDLDASDQPGRAFRKADLVAIADRLDRS